MMRLSESQKEIEELAKRVPQLTEKQKEWAKKTFNYFKVIAQGATEFRCPDCNCVVPMDYDKARGCRWNSIDRVLVCPHCGAKIQVRVDTGGYKPKSRPHQEDFFQVIDIVGDWQVTRLIYMQRYCYVKKENTPWEFWEVCQAWNNPKYGKTHFRAFPKTMLMCRPFNPYKLWDWTCTWDSVNKCYVQHDATPCELSPRKVGGANYFDTNAICPGARIHPSYKKMGITMRYVKKGQRCAMYLFESISGKNYKPMYETLLKSGDYTMYDHVTKLCNRNDADNYFTAWKICRRNHYALNEKNYSLWLDLVDMLIKRGEDIHNAHFVCPKDLREMHNYYHGLDIRDEEIRREMERRNRDEMARERARVAMLTREQKNEEFIKRRKPYYGIGIATDKFTIVCLRDIDEFEKEGKFMRHCVFTGGYYLKEDSLILSARDKNNKPIETIEIDLRSFRILQCYGKNDDFTELHDEIVSTMNKNMWVVKDIRNGRVKVAS